MVSVSQEKANIVVTMVTSKDTYVAGEQIKIAFRIDNNNPDIEGAEVTIRYYDDLGNEKTIKDSIGGYGLSKITEPITVYADRTFNACFDIVDIQLISSNPILEFTKLYFGKEVGLLTPTREDILVWTAEDGQLVYPLVIQINSVNYLEGMGGARENYARYYAPSVEVKISKCVYGPAVFDVLASNETRNVGLVTQTYIADCGTTKKYAVTEDYIGPKWPDYFFGLIDPTGHLVYEKWYTNLGYKFELPSDCHAIWVLPSDFKSWASVCAYVNGEKKGCVTPAYTPEGPLITGEFHAGDIVEVTVGGNPSTINSIRLWRMPSTNPDYYKFKLKFRVRPECSGCKIIGKDTAEVYVFVVPDIFAEMLIPKIKSRYENVVRIV